MNTDIQVSDEIKQTEIKRIDHIPIISGVIDGLGIVEFFDERILKYTDEKVTSCEVVKALILRHTLSFRILIKTAILILVIPKF